MKIFSKTILIKTKKPFDFVLIDEKINQVIAESKVNNGFVLLRSPHNTATIICNEDDPTVLADFKKNLKRLFPDELPWEHSYEGVNNARAHQVISLLGQTHWVGIENGKLKLGRWQSLFLIEFFQGRERRIEVIIVGE